MTIGRLIGCAVCMAAVLGTGLFAAADPPTPAAGEAKEAPPLDEQVRQACDRILADALEGGDFAAGAAKAKSLLTSVLAWEDLSASEAVALPIHAWRFLEQMAAAKGQLGEDAAPLARWIVSEKPLHLILPLALTERDRPEEVCGVLATLWKASPKAVAEFPNLATAICVVFDRPLTRHVNENARSAPDALEAFKFFAANDGRMLWGMKKVPWELLVWTVDVSSPIAELQWALAKYHGDKAVGKRFFDIEYDDAAYRGAAKKVNLAGYSLPNILKCGGICADQAYFAVEVGKAIGCPTAYAVGRGVHGGHAWVGFLQGQGGKAQWNFTFGRYKEHKYFRGNVTDPQTGQHITDSVAALLADALEAGAGGRRGARAYVDAAALVLAAGAVPLPGERLPMPTGGAGADRRGHRDAPRDGGVETALELLKQSVALCPAYRYSWALVGDLGAEGKLSTEQKNQWADALIKAVGKTYPDFTFDVLMPMAKSIEDAEAQAAALSKMFRFFRERPDLASDILLTQGELWEREGKPKEALDCYKQAVSKFLTDGPMVIDALGHIDKLLAGHGEAAEKAGIEILEKTFKALGKPDKFYNLQDSMWYQVGLRYADALKAAGKDAQAQKVRQYVTGGGTRN
jgi:tetratricopeptide (TPR) repeat protein